METQIRQLVQTIHDTSGRTVLVTAGAGTKALAWLLGVAGASRTLLEALVPYDWRAFNDFLGQEPAQYVAVETARLMAGRALTRGRWLHQDDEPIIGLACTATIATDRPKRGPHRAHVATWQAERVVSYSLHLEKGKRARPGEEDLVSRLMLNALAAAYGITPRLPLPLGTGDNLDTVTLDLAAAARRLEGGESDTFGVDADGCLRKQDANPDALLPGAFNPLHKGHLGMARRAEAHLSRPVAFELAAANVDKPPLAPDEVLARIAQFAGRWPVVVSNAPTFVEKARLYPGTTFVVGYDTATRIVAPRYYDDSEETMLAALAEIEALGCKFLVAGRANDEGEFHTIGELDLPGRVAHLFHPLPDFRKDISSTELRQQGKRGSR